MTRLVLTLLAISTFATCWSDPLILGWDRRLLPATGTLSRFVDVKADSDGNIVACGYVRRGGNLDALVAKYDPSGHLLWSQVYGGQPNFDDYYTSVFIAPDGTIYLTGRQHIDANNSSVLLRKLQPNGAGDPAWPNSVFGVGTIILRVGTSIDEGRQVLVAGTHVFVAANIVVDGVADVVVLKLNTTSPTLSNTWANTGQGIGQRRFSAPGGAPATNAFLGLDSAGNAYLGCTANFGVSGAEFAVKKLDTTGTASATWPDGGSGVGVRRYGVGLQNESLRAFHVSTAGVVTLAGQTQSATTGTDITAVRINAIGNQAWAYNYVTAGADVLQCMAILGTNTVLGGASVNDALTILLDSAGNPSSAWPNTGTGVGIRKFNDGGSNLTDGIATVDGNGFGAVVTTGGISSKVNLVQYSASGSMMGVSSSTGSPGNYADAFRAVGGSAGAVYVAGEGRLGGAGCALLTRFGQSFSFEVVGVSTAEGTEFDGDLASILTSDDGYYRAFNDERSLATLILVDCVARDSGVIQTRARLESSVLRVGLAFEIGARDWMTGNLVAATGGVALVNDSTAEFDLFGPQFERSETNEIQLFLRSAPINDEDPAQDGWLTQVDFVSGEVFF